MKPASRSRLGTKFTSVTLAGLLSRTGVKSLSRLKALATCWLIGHNIDPCDCYATECYRCRLVFPWDNPPRSDLGFYLTYYNSRGRIARVIRTIRGEKCSHCRKRIGVFRAMFSEDWYTCSKHCAKNYMPF